MVQTVENELKDTLGIPRPRKIAPLREAAKRLDDGHKAVKHQIQEKLARDDMKVNYLNTLKSKSRKDTHLNLKTDKKF